MYFNHQRQNLRKMTFTADPAIINFDLPGQLPGQAEAAAIINEVNRRVEEATTSSLPAQVEELKRQLEAVKNQKI